MKIQHHLSNSTRYLVHLYHALPPTFANIDRTVLTCALGSDYGLQGVNRSQLRVVNVKLGRIKGAAREEDQGGFGTNDRLNFPTTTLSACAMIEESSGDQTSCLGRMSTKGKLSV